MLVPFDTNVDEPEFRRLLLKHFPGISDEIVDYAGLVHMEMAALKRLANRSIKTGDLDYLKKIYEFAGDIGRHQSEVDPGVINAINVSFLEGLNFENKKNGEAAKRMLPPVLLQMWDAQMEHNRKIWLK